jgi:DNA-binding NtrC family response regulator
MSLALVRESITRFLMITILDVGQDALEARILAAILNDEYQVLHCPDPGAAYAALDRVEAAAILFDIDGWGKPELEGLDAGQISPPVIVLSGKSEPSLVIRAIRKGAVDFLAKPLDIEILKSALRKAIGPEPSFPFIGHSAAIRRTAQLLKSYARFDFPVLILGESGTGKEIAAMAIHGLSARSKAPFVPRNCAAFPENLIESELFGAAKGAYTGSVERPGAFELASGGSLFLDEIGESSLPAQAKLLRVLESGELWRLGASSPRHVDIRLISATSRDLELEPERMRSDLLYRINTLVLALPPLRERREDVGELADYFLRSACRSPKRFSREALDILIAEVWPGNVRQLKNVVHRAIVLSGDLEEIRPRHIMISSRMPPQ